MIGYLVLKYVHVGAVAASLGLFFLRGLWMMTSPERLRGRWVRVVPHGIDTLLLASALALTALTAQYPFVQPWLTAKVLALVAYILLGLIAFRYGRTRRQRIVAWVAALAMSGYIVAVAVTRQPVPWSG